MSDSNAVAGSTSLFERLGGDEALDVVVDLFYQKILGDDRVSHFFEGINMPRLKIHQKRFMKTAFGGGHHSDADLVAAHHGLEIQDEHFTAVAENLSESLSESGVSEPLIEEVIGIVATTKEQIVKSC